MSLYNHKVVRKRQNPPLPLYGSVVVSNPTPTASSLVQNSLAVADPNSTPTGIPLVDTPLGSSPTAVTPSNTPSPTAAPSNDSSSDIPLGTVIGACVGAFAALILAVLLAIYCSRRQKRADERAKVRNAAANSSRRRSHLEPWQRIEEDDADKWEGQPRQMKQRPPSGPMEKLGAMFHRTPSTTTTTGEKSSEGHSRESIGTMQHFAKYHPGLAAEMASQSTSQTTVRGVDGQIAKPPPAHQYIGRSQGEPPVSWDAETSGGGSSFLSLRSRLSGSMSDSLMVTAKSTPAATPSSAHRWESAEVLHVDDCGSEFSEARELRNPFEDNAASVKSSVKGHNPFFGARDEPVKRVILPNTHNNPFADAHSIPNHESRTDSVTSASGSGQAIQSLIAALGIPHDGERIVSVQSSYYSRMTEDDGDVVSVTAFPYPPTQVPRP